MGDSIVKLNEVFATCFHRGSGKSCFYVNENALIYVASGRLEVLIDDKKVASFSKGESIFVRKDHRMTIINYPEMDEYHLAVILSFPRKLLFEYYKTLHDSDLPESVERSKKSYLAIPQSSLLTSLFDSFKPFWEKGECPGQHWLRIKVLEAIRLLLLTDKSIYASLFDFTSKWKIDILDFLEENYMYDLSLNELAFYTGRSLATFKRDFKKLSDDTPRNWIINRRLRETRHYLLTTSWSIFKILEKVGFKNFSHFSRRYHLLYHETPSETRASLHPN